ncbi:prominin-1-A-like [Crassostrea virginica]
MERQWVRVGLCVCVGIAVCFWTVEGNGGFTLPPGPAPPDYKADEAVYEDGGMGPLYNFARKFINMCLSDIKDVLKVIKDAIKGKIGSNIQDLLETVRENFLGFSVSVVVGLLFIVIFPIVGCCFCCCRIGCKACCAQPEEEDPNVSCKKAVYGTVLFVLVAFTAAGNICVYVSNDRISLALTEVVDNVDTNLDDIKLFMDHSTKQIEQIRTNFHATKTELEKHLDSSIPELKQYQHERGVISSLGRKLDFVRLCELAEELNLIIPADDWGDYKVMDKRRRTVQLNDNKLADTLQKKAISLLTGGAVQDLQTNIDAAKTAMTSITTGLSSFDAACVSTPPCPLGGTVTFPTIPTVDISGQASASVQAGINNGLSGALTAINDAKTQLNSADTKVSNLVDNTKDAIQKGDTVNVKKTKEMVKDQKDFISPYDKYRWYAGIGCAGIVSLILAFYCCGICCGCCGGRSVNDPLEKGCVSNCAGRFMIGSLVFIFVFCPLLMLITTLLYIPGAVIERYVCQPLTDPNLEFLDELMDSFEMKFDSIVKHESGHEMSLKMFLSNCKNNMAIYNALDLEHLTLFSFKFSDLENEVSKIMTHMNSGMGTLLTDSTAFAGADLLPTSLDTALNDVKTKIGTLNLATLQSAINGMDSVVALSPTNAPLKQALDDIKAAKARLDTLKTDIPTAVDSVKQQLINATNKIKSDGMKNIAQSFVNETVNIIDMFVKDVKYKLHNEIGQCQPLWNMYNSIIKISLCQYIVDAFNGFWFSIGWCIFFLLPGAVVGTKLSNFLRDVEYAYDNRDAESGKPKRTKKNQVGHKDEEED